MNARTLPGGGGDLHRANLLMIDALLLLDRHRHPAAAYLDHAIATLGLRPEGEGMPEGY